MKVGGFQDGSTRSSDIKSEQTSCLARLFKCWMGQKYYQLNQNARISICGIVVYLLYRYTTNLYE